MNTKSVFNAAVCLIGFLILFIHALNIILKKDRRKDEKSLLAFIVFTAIHFLTYYIFTVIKERYTSDAFIMSFYTVFYIMNNIELLLFYLYLTSYSNVESKTKKITDIINYSLFAVFVISDIVNIFTRMYFTSIGGVYFRQDLMIVSQGYQFVMLAVCFILTVINKSLNFREKLAFYIYCVLPVASIIIQNNLPGYAIAYMVLLFAIEILFLFINVEKNIKLREDEKQLKEADMKIMVSQIQPHFVYNTLSSISTLIPLDPDKAQKALDDFSDYLRMNFSTLTSTKLVSFEDELKHIQTYVSLEKLRFNNRLNFIYEIETTNFYLPPLSIQPLVENAIKHGILKKVEGGTVTLKTREDDSSYIVEIIDDGVGFDMNNVDFKSNKHIGLNNVRHRITSMTKGEISFNSKVGEGTHVIVKFYK